MLRIDVKKVASLMEQKKINNLRLCLMLQMEPLRLMNILSRGECCKETAQDIANALEVELKDIEKDG